jgi:hypothetical protein
LDAYGKPEAESFKYRSYFGPGGWKKGLEVGKSSQKFAAGLPKFAADRLHHVSGFLAKNPGSQPVSFDMTEKETAKAIFEIVEIPST